MSLCIAAGCFDPFGPSPEEVARRRTRLDPNAAVLSSDMRLHNGDSAADIGRKTMGLTPLWCALLAGSMSDAAALARVCGRALAQQEATLDEASLPATIHAAIRFRVADAYTSASYGISYADVLSNRGDRLSPDVLTRILKEVNDLDSPDNVQLIFVGWLKTRFIMVGYSHGQVWVDENFCVIGSGTPLASELLYGREQRAFTPYPTAIYNVYEAQRAGSAHRDVGSETRMSLLRYDRERARIFAKSIHGPPGGILDRLFRKTWIHSELDVNFPVDDVVDYDEQIWETVKERADD